MRPKIVSSTIREQLSPAASTSRPRASQTQHPEYISVPGHRCRTSPRARTGSLVVGDRRGGDCKQGLRLVRRFGCFNNMASITNVREHGQHAASRRGDMAQLLSVCVLRTLGWFNGCRDYVWTSITGSHAASSFGRPGTTWLRGLQQGFRVMQPSCHGRPRLGKHKCACGSILASHSTAALSKVLFRLAGRY